LREQIVIRDREGEVDAVEKEGVAHYSDASEFWSVR
jgi:hypothetical protein